MVKTSLRWRYIDTAERTVVKFERDVGEYTFATIQKIAFALTRDIRENWSNPPAPSNRGRPPALDKDVNTGNLDSAIKTEGDRAGKGTGGGRFIPNKDKLKIQVNISATEGEKYHGRGDYATALEKGTRNMAARPFVEPALNRIKGTFSDYFTRGRI